MERLSFLDIGVLAIMTISIAIAFLRGFIREALSISGWLAAVGAAVYGAPLLRPFARRYISLTWAADAATAVFLFLMTLLLCSLVAHALSKKMRDCPFGVIDRALGILFGASRAAVVVCLATLAMRWALPDQRPQWIESAQSLPLMEQGADLLLSLVVRVFPVGKEPPVAGNTPTQLRPTDATSKPAYNAQDQDQLDQLIESTQ